MQLERKALKNGDIGTFGVREGYIVEFNIARNWRMSATTSFISVFGEIKKSLKIASGLRRLCDALG